MIPAHASELRLKDRAEVSGRYIKGSDVIEGFIPQSELAAVLARVYLGGSPAQLRRDYVQRRLELAGIDLGAKGLQGPARCVVTARGFSLEGVSLAETPVQGPTSRNSPPLASDLPSPSDTASFEAAVLLRAHRLVAQHTGWAEGEFEVTLEHISLAREHRPQGAFTIVSFGGDLPADERQVLGRQVFHVDFAADNAARARVPVQVRVARRLEVAVARRNLLAGAVIVVGDLGGERRLVDDRSDEALTRPDLLVGQIATRALRAGETLTRGAVRMRLFVKRGERVRVAQPMVSTFAVAQGHGMRGEVITVKAESSERTFRARIIDLGVVEPVTERGADDRESTGETEGAAGRESHANTEGAEGSRSAS